MPEDDKQKSIFINCPFDKEFEPLLQATLFTCLYLGFTPRLALETKNSADVRLDKIRRLIESCGYSVHDLSRCQSKRKGEHYRLNMPFELGMDYSCRLYKAECQNKKILILEEKPYRYQAALSDLAGCDIETHANNPQNAMRKLRNWLASEARCDAPGPARIWASYMDFQAYYMERQLLAGFSEDDILDFPTSELLDGMRGWISLP